MRSARTSLILLLGLLLLAGTGLAGEHIYIADYYPTYWITGNVLDATDGTVANGRSVYFYRSLEDYKLGRYASDIVGVTGGSGRDKRYMINIFGLGISELAVGSVHYLAIPTSNFDNPAEGHGTMPVQVTISGRGFDEAPDLQLAKGANPLPPPPALGREFAPTIKVWFGRRLYQPSIFGRPDEGKQPFVVPSKGKFKLEIDIADPFQLNEASSYALRVQSPAGETRAFDLSGLTTFRASAVGTKPLIIESDYPEELRALETGDSIYTFTFFARSRGNLALPTTVSTQAAVMVMAGPTQLVGRVLTYPSPVSLRTDREAYIQYTLSRDANIDIFFFDISARVVKKMSFYAGEEGGSAGVNKVKWDLMTDQGQIISSGIYINSFVDRESGKLLGKGKFTAAP